MKFHKGRLAFFIILIIAYGCGFFWLKQHPEYTTYDPDAIMRGRGGEMYYIEEICPKQDFPELVESQGLQKKGCMTTIKDVPPAYYIHSWLLKNKSRMVWGSWIVLVIWGILYRKTLVHNFKVAQKFLDELNKEQHGNIQQDKKRKGRRKASRN